MEKKTVTRQDFLMAAAELAKELRRPYIVSIWAGDGSVTMGVSQCEAGTKFTTVSDYRFYPWRSDEENNEQYRLMCDEVKTIIDSQRV